MRRGDKVIQLEQRVVARRLFVEHIARRPGNYPRSERFVERGFVNQLPPARINEKRRGLHSLKLCAANQPLRFGSDRRMQRDEIRFCQQVTEGKVTYAPRCREVLIFVGVRGYHVHSEAFRAPADAFANLAQADNPQCLPAQFRPHEPFPLAFFCGDISLRYLPRCREQQGHCHIRDRIGNRASGDCNRDPPRFCGFEIDILESDSVFRNHFQVGGCRENARRHRLGSRNQHVGNADEGDELIFRRSAVEVVRDELASGTAHFIQHLGAVFAEGA